MSTVYKVRIPKVGKIVALKLLSPHPHLVGSLGMGEIKDRFVSEAMTMASLRHPNIVSIWDFDEAEGKPFLVMEYYCNSLGIIIGETYRLENPSRTLTPEKTIHYLRQILEGLKCLHQAGIVHRDIKPYNILVTDEDRVKITDFAFSKIRGEHLHPPSNLVVGSPYYAAPEQEREPDGVDYRADIYSLGVMAYRMLTGTLPVKAEIRPDDYSGDMNQEWDSFLAKATSQERQNRFGSSAEMLERLEQLASKWEENKERICSEAPPPKTRKLDKTGSKQLLRSESIKIGPRQAREIFQLDELWRPRHYLHNNFEEKDDSTVVDCSTDLLWQKHGSDFPMTWNEAELYVRRLNSERFGGQSNWRLPTVDELSSLLIETAQAADWCLPPIFSRDQRIIWSADRSSFIAAWYVSVDMGFIAWQDYSCCFFVRAVCSNFSGNFAKMVSEDH